MTVSIPSPWKDDGYFIGHQTCEVPDLLTSLAPDATLGRGILEQVQMWLKNAQPVDSAGYPYFWSEGARDSWRDYELRRVRHALITLAGTEKRTKPSKIKALYDFP